LKNTSNSEDDFQWTKFAGLASQWAVALSILLFLGKYLDKKDFNWEYLFLKFLNHSFSASMAYKILCVVCGRWL
jgi:hypothetical protein